MKYISDQTKAHFLSKSFRFEGSIYLFIFVTGLLLRLYEIASRAMHHDESLHAYYSWELSQGSGLIHNPMLHGPLQMELTALIFFLLGDNDTTARLLYAFAGSVLILLPVLIRNSLGKYGAITTATLLAISPTMVYFSRFARNDILMAVFAFGIVIAMWKYLVSGNKKNLYIISALLALCFSTKESAYLIVAILGLYLTLTTIYDSFQKKSFSASPPHLSYPNFILFYSTRIFKILKDSFQTQPYSRPFTVLILLISLTLPQWSAFSGILQETILMSWSDIVLVSGQSSGNIGLPSHGGKLLAFVIVVILIITSAYLGFRWQWKTWWRCALIFYVFWIAAYTTFFTNISGGVQSGIWQSLGYWIVQQGESRGNQPAYYYLLITLLYEFLPLFVSLTSVIYYFKRKAIFAKFLIFWSIATFLMYTIASEKMPWLLVHITLPMIVLSGKVLGDYFKNETVLKLVSLKNCFLVLLMFALLFFAWRLAFFGIDGNADNFWMLLLLAFGLVLVVLGVGFLVINDQNKISIKVIGLSIIFILLCLSVRSGVIATYKNGDIPVEMLVYTQTSPDVPSLARQIAKIEAESGNKPTVDVDSTSGFQWPWAWYLRDIAMTGYPQYGQHLPSSMMEQEVLIIHSQNKLAVQEPLKEKYGEAIRFRHRWWFPEHTYRDLSLKKIILSISDRSAWTRSIDYFLYRDLNHNLSSEDAYVYFDDPEMRNFRSLELK